MYSLEFLEDVARGAGRIIKDKYHDNNAWREKSGPGDVVTEVDELSERYIIDRVHCEYSHDDILSEEAGAIGSGEGKNIWIMDPLDGTRNYMMRVPFFCVSIAVAREGRAFIGVTDDPIHDEMFSASRGEGAFLNGERIRIPNQESLEDSVISVSWVKRKVDRGKFVEYIRDISKDTSYFRRFGAAALVMCYVACGRVHGYLQGGLNPWDVAAGTLIIEEAGGVVTDFAGQPINLGDKDIEVLTANPKLHDLLLNRVILRAGAS